MPHNVVRIGFGTAFSSDHANRARFDDCGVTGKAESAPGTAASTFTYNRAASGAILHGADASGAGNNQVQTTPTRALWIGSIPASTTPSDLLNVFSPFGPIESARVLTHKNCGFVNMERLDDAVRARKALNGRELFGSQVGVIKSA
jgi:protein JSN1